MMYEVKRTDKEINDLLDRCAEQEDKGGSRYPGMSYEQGIRAAIDWITGCRSWQGGADGGA